MPRTMEDFPLRDFVVVMYKLFDIFIPHIKRIRYNYKTLQGDRAFKPCFEKVSFTPRRINNQHFSNIQKNDREPELSF